MKKIYSPEDFKNENSRRLVKDYKISIDELVDNCDGIPDFLYEKIFLGKFEEEGNPLNYFSQISRKLLLGAIILYEASEGKNFYVYSEYGSSFVNGCSKIIENFKAAAYYENLANDFSKFQEKYIKEIFGYENLKRKKFS